MIEVRGSKYRALAVSVAPGPGYIKFRIEDNGNVDLWVEVLISTEELQSYVDQMKHSKAPTPATETTTEPKQPETAVRAPRKKK